MRNADIFEFATRNKLRFNSSRGPLSVEQLWDVPLRSNDGFNLNEVAKAANKILNSATEEDFVETGRTAHQTRLEVSLEVVKHVIDAKLEDEKAAKRHSEKRIEKERLLLILSEKQNGKMSDIFERELQRRIEALGK